MTCILPVHRKETQDKSSYQNGGSHHLKIHPSAKDGSGSQLWEVTRKSTVNKGKVKPFLSALIVKGQVQRGKHSHKRGFPLQVQMSFTSDNFYHKQYCLEK